MRPIGAFGTLIAGIVLGAGGTLLLISRVPLDNRETAAITIPGDRPAPVPQTVPASAPVIEPATTAAPVLTPAQAAPIDPPHVAGAGKAGDSLAGMRAGDTSGTGGLVASGSGTSLFIPVAGVKPEQIDTIFFTGGSSGVGMLRDRIGAVVPSARKVEGDLFGSIGAGLALDAVRKFA